MLEELAPPIVVVIVEFEAETRTDIAGAPTVDYACDGGAHVEPATIRSSERDEEIFAGEDSRVGFHEHALRREIDSDARDALKIVLANDLAAHENAASKRTSMHFTG